MITNISNKQELEKYATTDSKLIIKCPVVPKNTLHYRMMVVAFILLIASILVFSTSLYIIQRDISNIKEKYGGFSPWEITNNNYDAQMMRGHIDSLYLNQDKREETIILNGLVISSIILVGLIIFVKSKRVIAASEKGIMVSPFLPKNFAWSDFSNMTTTETGVIVLSIADKFGIFKRKIYIDAKENNAKIATFLQNKIKHKKK